jgi:cytochrome P450
MCVCVATGIDARITANELVDNVLTFYTAGSETTSVGISWSLFFISQNPEITAKIRSEILPFITTTGDVSKLRLVTNIGTNLPYTSAAFKEALRIRSPAIMLPLELVNREGGSFTLESSGVVVDGSTSIHLNFNAALHDPSVYKVEPRRYIPERWMTEDREELSRMETNFLTFGGGRRVCPGMNLAYAEGTLAIAILVHFFDFTLACPPHEVKPILRFTTQPNKMPFIITKRL